MNNSTKIKRTNPLVVIILILLPFAIFLGVPYSLYKYNEIQENKTFKLISSESNKGMDSELKKFAKKKNINIKIDYYGDLEIVDKLNEEANDYDGVWISNSIWLYMLDNPYLISDSKSIAITPVVMGITKQKAKSLGFTDKTIYNKDILNAISSKKLKYVMTSVTKTNTGATAYLSLLNSLAGSPEVLTSDMLKNKNLTENMKNFFTGVSRVSGDEDYLIDMFNKGEYEAIINYESTLISLNQKLVKNGKDPLYLLYPEDGVGINDMPFAYVSRGQSEKKKENFKALQDYLRSDKVREKLENKGYRSWYGGIKENTPSNLFNKDWGIDTTKYLIPFKYPSKQVMNDAFDLYVEKLRKPTHVVFCLDVSGSMYGSGITELKQAMDYILDRDKARVNRLQFSSEDKVTIITFNHQVDKISSTLQGIKIKELIPFVNNLEADGGTNIYDSSIKALEILSKENKEKYTTTAILMTDGQSNYGSISTLSDYYNKLNKDIPIYSITFGNAVEDELNDIANLTNAKVFNGKDGLKKAFEEVRSYN